jgi:hypothetical protein
MAAWVSEVFDGTFSYFLQVLLFHPHLEVFLHLNHYLVFLEVVFHLVDLPET